MMTSNEAIVPLAEDAFWQSPYPILSRLRDEHRTAVTDAGVKAILRWDDAEEVLKGGDFINEGLEFIEARGFSPGDPLYEWRRHSIGALNGAPHDRIRSLVSRALTHRSVDALRPSIRAHTRALISACAEAGRMDARADLALRLPFLTITEFLGIDRDEGAEVGKRMSSGAADAFGPNVTPEIRQQANETFAALMAFVSDLVEKRRVKPREDLLSDLIRVEEAGDRLSQEELIVLFTNIFGGAIETTASVLTSGVMLLAQNPEQAERLRRDPDRFKQGAAEETLRLRPGFYAVGKKAARSVEAAGLRFDEGEPLTILVGGPNRDPSRWLKPDAFEIGRDPKVWSLTFSMGAHFCLGQALARCELQEMMGTLVTCCRELELEVDPPRWLARVMVNRVESLPVRFHHCEEALSHG
ncbi:cytochrome P450 [Myxococcota bacterium]|nr:cytochrome P450 [Myxococcota bacterium]